MTIDILPDDALLDIFSFYLVDRSKHIEPWHTLVHVCQRWRSIVFASPRRLDVQVFYMLKRQVNAMLDIWPNLPIEISALRSEEMRARDIKNLVATLKHTDRICQIQLKDFSCFELEGILPAIEKSFPALTSLTIECYKHHLIRFQEVMVMSLPQTFLGRSAQHLWSCNLVHIDFPGIWKLLLTANHLVTLRLWDIPFSTHTSPDGMATLLSMMPNLESLSIGFLSPRSLHDWHDQSK